jgi:hypothetical protein
MTEEEKTIDFLKVIKGIEIDKEKKLKDAFKQMRFLYIELIKAGFTMQEAMAYLAALSKNEKD